LASTAQFVTDDYSEKRELFSERIMQSLIGAFDVFTIYLGDRLGYYRALKKQGPLTSRELAAHTGTSERYAREWLEQQAAATILEVEEPVEAPEIRKFRLPPGHDEVLADHDSLNYLAPMTQLFAGAVSPIRDLIAAFRSGDGIPFERYGPDLRDGQAGVNRAMFLQQLGPEWLAAIPDLPRRLEAGPPARVADIGCGVGWSSIGIARNYPKVLVDGFDTDPSSIDLARTYAKQYGVSDRAGFHCRDAGDSSLAGTYDLVVALECVHDMADPVAALQTMRRLVREDGFVLVVDERVGEEFRPDAGDVERLMYGWSVLHCLPSGMTCDGVGTGTVMRPATLRRYARAAGFKEIETLPVDHIFFRFYRLVF